MAMKIASRKKKIPSIAKAMPKASPKRFIIPGQSSPNSNESTVPLTAPTAKVTATTFDQRWASFMASASSCLRARYSAASVIAGKAMPEAGEDDVEPERERHLVARRQQVGRGVGNQGRVRHLRRLYHRRAGG